MQTRFLFYFLICCLLACKPAPDSREETSSQEAEEVTPVTLANIEPRLASFDSIQALFYHDPFGGDKERYTRYYNHTAVSDSAGISALQEQLLQPFVKSDTLRTCRSEGKLYVFEQGRIKQTIYFARRPEACRHAYIIHEGFYYYLPLNRHFEEMLGEWQGAAVEP